MYIWKLGKLGEFDKSGSNCQNKTNKYKPIAIRASTLHFNLTYKYCIQ